MNRRLLVWNIKGLFLRIAYAKVYNKVREFERYRFWNLHLVNEEFFFHLDCIFYRDSFRPTTKNSAYQRK